jgi:ubiquinone/menaquinone biosynthesis C-methylase UbiE
MMTTALFDTWPDRYDRWFEIPTGRLVREYESTLLLEFLDPHPGERILDVGCGTGIFTQDVLNSGAIVTGVDLSLPMLKKAMTRMGDTSFTGLCGDMYALPFLSNSFDKVFSMTAIEFVADAGRAIAELDRVTRKGGRVVVTTLNSLSPWAEQRQQKAQDSHSLFEKIYFRSPDDMRLIVPERSIIKTAIHFQKNDPVVSIPEIERSGSKKKLNTGAFLAVQWDKA